MKFKALALLAAGAFVAGSAFAGDKACCAQHAKNDKSSCMATFASLDLTAEQKAKIETAVAECEKAGCTEASMATMEANVQGILSKEQFAAWQSACKRKTAEKQS